MKKKKHHIGQNQQQKELATQIPKFILSAFGDEPPPQFKCITHIFDQREQANNQDDSTDRTQ